MVQHTASGSWLQDVTCRDRESFERRHTRRVGEIRVKRVGFQPFSRNYQVRIWYYSMPREKDTFVRLLKQPKKSPGCSYILKIVATYAIHLPLELSRRILGKTSGHLAHQVGARALRVLKMLTSPTKVLWFLSYSCVFRARFI